MASRGIIISSFIRLTDSVGEDYEATSYDGPRYDHIWFASQYSNKKGDWTTRIGADQLH